MYKLIPIHYQLHFQSVPLLHLPPAEKRQVFLTWSGLCQSGSRPPHKQSLLSLGKRCILFFTTQALFTTKSGSTCLGATFFTSPSRESHSVAAPFPSVNTSQTFGYSSCSSHWTRRCQTQCWKLNNFFDPKAHYLQGLFLTVTLKISLSPNYFINSGTLQNFPWVHIGSYQKGNWGELP